MTLTMPTMPSALTRRAARPRGSRLLPGPVSPGRVLAPADYGPAPSDLTPGEWAGVLARAVKLTDLVDVDAYGEPFGNVTLERWVGALARAVALCEHGDRVRAAAGRVG